MKLHQVLQSWEKNYMIISDQDTFLAHKDVKIIYSNKFLFEGFYNNALKRSDTKVEQLKLLFVC